MTVNLNGEAFSYDYIDIIQSEFKFTSDQESEPWGVGRHTATAEVYGESVEYTVEIVPTEIASLTAEEIVLNENKNGDWRRSGDGERDWYYHYRITPGKLTATFKNGEVKEFLYSDASYDEAFVIDPQSADAPWEPGRREADIYFMGAPCKLEVNVIPTEVEKIEISPVSFAADERLQPVSWSSGEESGVYYVYDSSPQGITVTYKDGRTVSGTRYYIQRVTGEKFSFYDGQDKDNRWGIGTHTVRMVFDGYLAYYEIEITPVKVPGDINGDGDVTVKDVLLMRRYIAGLEDLTDEQLRRGDMNGDGDVTTKDVLKARRYIAGLD